MTKNQQRMYEAWVYLGPICDALNAQGLTELAEEVDEIRTLLFVPMEVKAAVELLSDLAEKKNRTAKLLRSTAESLERKSAPVQQSPLPKSVPPVASEVLESILAGLAGKDVAFFLDTSGSMWSGMKRIFDFINVHCASINTTGRCLNSFKVYTFDTKVRETINQKAYYGGGGTQYDIIETHLQKQRSSECPYPDAVIVISDGYGTVVRPEFPERWHCLVVGGDHNLQCMIGFVDPQCKIYQVSEQMQ